MEKKNFRKYLVIGIMILFVGAGVLPSIGGNIEKTSSIPLSKNMSKTSFDADVPIWTVGNTWTYKIDNMVVDFDKEGQSIYLTLETDKLQLKVVEDTGDSYVVEIYATLKGSGVLNIDLGEGPINITMNFRNIKLTGTIVFDKSDLSIKQLNPKLMGRLWVKINEQPITNFSIPPIPFSATINIFTDLSVPLKIIDFPLNVSNVWGIPGTNIALDGTIKSPYLSLLNTINNIARNRWNFTIIIANFLGIDEETLKLISDMLYDILPIVNISYVLQKYLEIGNVFEIPEIPDIFICNDIEEITVQGKTYEAYNISVIGGLGNIYYATEVGNILKISGYFKDIIPFISDLKVELIETNYQP